ncbi:cytochrome c [Moritella sp. Urea-trap-13]|uniref:c-type cytochrome n=1 Tax=Moritella sp. Urea-trap-13 TaxID=2058327 RepID=UPI000C33FD9E|nr:cytochrome c [Moritella sp. Urea-trap-13]PKH08125.1 cytochrome C [Moritella sp. Urea-trap-13]
MSVSKRVNAIITALSLTFSLVITSVAASENILTASLIQDVEQRQAAFSQIETQQKQIDKALGKSSPNWQQLEVLSSELAANSASLQHLFVSGSQFDSKAKGKVWDDNMQFKAALEKMNNSFIKMDTAIQQQDKRTAKDALKQANNTCRNCHRQYRSRW